MSDPNALFKNITRVKSFTAATPADADAATNNFIQTVLEADPDHNYSVRIINGYLSGADYTIVIEYTYIIKTEEGT